MKKFFLFYVRYSVTALLFASTIISPSVINAQAMNDENRCAENWWAYCCKCGVTCVVVTPLPAFGYCRHCNLLCRKCRKELGELNEALEKLKRKNRVLKEAYDAFEKGSAEGLQKYNDARENMYGEEAGGWWRPDTWGVSGMHGSLGKYFGAGFGVLSNTGNATEAFKAISNGISIYQSSGTSDHALSWSGTFIDVFTESEYSNMFFEHMEIKEAMEMYNHTVAGNGTLDVAINTFNKRIDALPENVESAKDVLNKIGFLMDVWGYYSATKDLFKDISDAKEGYEDYEIAEKEMKKITDSIVKNVTLMICIRETLDSINAGGLGGGSGITNQPSKELVVNVLTPTILKDALKFSSWGIDEISILKYPVDSVWQMNLLAVQTALLKLKQLQILQLRMEKRIEKEIFPPLIPWITNRWKELKPAVLLKSLQKAQAGLKILINEMNQLKALDESIKLYLEVMIQGYETDYLSDGPDIISSKENNEDNTTGIIDKWAVRENGKIKGEVGRLNMNSLAAADWSIDIHNPDNKYITNRSSFSKHPRFYDLVPGNYNFTLNHVTVENVPVEKGKETRLKAGFLKIVSTKSWELYDGTKKKYYTSGNKPVKFALPVGRYQLNFEGKYYPVVIDDGGSVKFEIPVTSVLNQIK